ncbi:hypothetical protein AgCh_035262 [Apium graveolens]
MGSLWRERDTSEAERAQHVKQIHDFQDHMQEKERQFMEWQEQHRASQETLSFKDEQLREAQTWITRALEMDALQTTTNQTLQAELRERTEQYNQLWMNCQRQHQSKFIDIEFDVASYSTYSQNNSHFQFAEFVHTIQALQIELADLRQRNATSTDESRASELNIKDALQSGNNVGNQLNVSGDCQTHDSGTLPNGNFENDLSSKSQGNASGHVGRVKPLNYHMVKEDMRLQRKESRNRAVTIFTLPIISFSQTHDN